MPIDISLKSELEKLDQKYGGDEMHKILGSTLLSYTSTDSARMYMFTSHVKQILTLLNPDIPRIQTGFENKIGSYSTAYKYLDGSWTVKDIIKKYPDKDTSIFLVVLYNKKKDLYDMIESPVAQSLTEKFGYVFNLDKMRSLSVGDRIKNEVLYKSTSFDSHMNYRYGKNAKVFYSTSTDTLEDAVVVRKGWADGVKSVEIDAVNVSINTNEVPINLYGDDDHYKCFPDIGETVNHNQLCAVRVINNDHLLYDFQKKNMKDSTETDSEYFVSKGAEIYDIDVYYNGQGEFPKSVFFNQIRGYYEDGCAYARKVYLIADEIKRSGSNYTQNITYFRSKYIHYNDKEYKWKNKDRAFANMLITFKVKAVVPLEFGSKLAGRFGDKGVVSGIVDTENTTLKDSITEMLKDEGRYTEEEIYKMTSNIAIVDDARMPYTDDGPIDILLNQSSSIRRLNPGQLGEVETNFIGEQVRKKICLEPDLQKKEEMIFKFISILNEGEATFFQNLYHSFDETINVDGFNIHMMAPERKKDFIREIEEYGFYIVRPPHKPIVYSDVLRLYEAFPFVKPLPMYIDLFGQKKRRIIRDGVVGTKYMIILKQNSNKNFSARSTFRVGRSNLPTKDVAKKTNRSSYARTPVRLSEIYNLMASISGRDLAEYNVFMRSSPLGSKSLDRILSADDNPLKIKKLKVQDNYINVNAQILAARLKSIGIALEFSTSKDEDAKEYPPDTIIPITYDHYTVYDRADRREMYLELFREFDRIMRTTSFIETYVGEKHDWAWYQVFKNKDLKYRYPIMDQALKQILITATKGLALETLSKLTEKPHRKAAPAETPTTTENAPKKRGRKPKVKEIDALVQETMSALAEDELESDDEVPFTEDESEE